MSTPKLLAVVTNIATLGPDGPPNGTFLSEIAHALHEVEVAGIDYDIASPKGGPAPFYGVDECRPRQRPNAQGGAIPQDAGKHPSSLDP